MCENEPLRIAERMRLDVITQIQNSMLDAVWPEGRNPDAPWDGIHYILKGYVRPVSVSSSEAYFLTNIVLLSGVTNILEIGTGFGYSAMWLALGLLFGKRRGTVITLDNYTEGGLGHEGLRAAQTMAQRLGVGYLIEFAEGSSPEGVPLVVDQRSVDMAFVDANHHGTHPVDDYVAVKRFLGESSVLLFHDVDATRYSVPVGRGKSKWRRMVSS